MQRAPVSATGSATPSGANTYSGGTTVSWEEFYLAMIRAGGEGDGDGPLCVGQGGTFVVQLDPLRVTAVENNGETGGATVDVAGQREDAEGR